MQKPTQGMTKENARKLAIAQIDALLDCHQEGEWISLSQNLTGGPGEGPVLHLSFLPATTAENAKYIQDQFLRRGADVNAGK